MQRFPHIPHSRPHHMLLALGILPLAGLTTAHADVQYTTVMSIPQGEGGKLAPMSTTTTWMKDGLERTDSKQSIGPIKMSETTISSKATGSTIKLDSDLKIYVSEPLGGTGAAPGMPKTMPTGMGGQTAPSKPGVGTMTMTFGVKFIGTEKLLDYQTRHNITTLGMSSTGCCGIGDHNFKIEDWKADVKLPVFAYPHPDSAAAYGGMGDSKCKITFTRKGDVAGYTAAQKGLALKTLMYDESGKLISSSQITLLSFAALKDSDFAAPADFKKVSQADYDSMRQKAMMKSMMGNIGKMGQDTDADDEKPATTTDAGTVIAPTTDTPTTDTATPETPTPDAAPDAGDAAKDTGKNAGKNKLKKKFKLPF